MTPEQRKRFPPLTTEAKDGSTIVVRPLSPDDGAALAEFYASVPEEDYRFYCPHELSREKALENASKADSPLEIVLVVELPDGRVGGYGWYRWEREDAESCVFGICLRRECQGLGAGRALMKRLEEIGAELAPPKATLTVQLANERGVALYRKMGFRVVGEDMREERYGFAPEPQYHMERPTR